MTPDAFSSQLLKVKTAKTITSSYTGAGSAAQWLTQAQDFGELDRKVLTEFYSGSSCIELTVVEFLKINNPQNTQNVTGDMVSMTRLTQAILLHQ